MPSPLDTQIGRAAVEAGWVTAPQIEAARREQERRSDTGGSPSSFGRLLVESGLLTEERLAELLRKVGIAGAGGGATIVDAAISQSAKLATLPTLPDRDALRAPSAGPDGIPFGRYRLLEEVGRGGMGVVYRAWDTELRREVAVKTVPSAAAGGREFVERLLREARTAATLDHPGIVPVHDVGEVDGVPYFAMAFVRGRSLEVVLKEGKAVGLRERARLVHDAARAVAHAHERRVIHRDLKPSNLQIDEQGGVHVMDFGLARRLDEATRITVSGQMLGTPQYMPPEQMDGRAEEVGPASDVYSLGAVLYEALTGRPPFPGATVAEIVARALVNDPEPPRRADPRIPIDLETICLRALHKEPARRYPTAKELAADLARWLNGEAIEARRETWTSRGTRWVRRRKLASALALVACVALACAGLLFWKTRVAAAERRQLEREKLASLRQTAALTVDAALMVRRSGGRMSEAAERFFEPLREAAEQTSACDPGLAEPDFHLGRMQRALLRNAEARASQERALARDPEYAPALYELAVLWGQETAARSGEARTRFLAGMGRRMAEEGRLAPGVSTTRVTEPSPAELEAADSTLKQAQAECVRALARLKAVCARDPSWAGHAVPLLRVGPAQIACAEGLLGMTRPGGGAEAQAALERAVREDPRLEEAYEALYLTAVAQGKWDEAIAACARGIEADRGYLPHWRNRGDARLKLGMSGMANGADAQPLFEEADADYAGGIALAPGNSSLWSRRACARVNVGICRYFRGEDPVADYRAGLAQFEKALELDPGNLDALTSLGDAYENLGVWKMDRGQDPENDFAAAEAAYTRALDKAPTAEAAWVARGTERLNRGAQLAQRGGDPLPHYRDAIADFDRALTLDPSHAEAWQQRGQAHLQCGNDQYTRGEDLSAEYERALADFRKTSACAPGLATPHVAAARVRMNLGCWKSDRGADPTADFAACTEECTRVVAAWPSCAEAFRYRGLTLTYWALYESLHGGDGEERFASAARDAERVTTMRPGDAGSWVDAAATWANWASYSRTPAQGDERHRRAVDALGEALRLNPRDGHTWSTRGATRMNWGVQRVRSGADPTETYRAAEEDCNQSIAINGNDFEAYRMRGAVRMNAAEFAAGRGEDAHERYGKAAEDLEASLRLNPSQPDAKTWLERCRKEAGTGK